MRNLMRYIEVIVVVVLAAVLLRIEARKVVSLHCPDYSQHPSIQDALQAALPQVDISQWIAEESLPFHEQDLPDWLRTVGQVSSAALQQRLYLSSWLSDAHYSVTFNDTMESLSFQDVFLLQESHWRLNLLCQALPQGIPYVSALCHCPASMQFQHSTWMQKQVPVYDREEDIDKARWCWRKARCTSHDMQMGRCLIPVDPIRRSCVVLQHDELLPAQHWHHIDMITQYEEAVPMLVNVLPTGWKKKYYHPYHQEVKQVVVEGLSHVPYYLFSLALGMFVMYYASDLAEDPFFHFFLEAFIGVFFALFVLAFLGKKVVNRMLGAASHGSYGLIPIPTLFSIIYLVVTNPYAAAYVRDTLYDFWDNGAFGLPWLGKTYFMVCIALSLSISKYYRLFSEESSFAPLMIYSVKVIGLLFLCNSSSSREISLTMVLIGLCAEHLRDWFNYLYLLFNAKAPRYVVNQRKMNDEEFEAFQSVHTKKHLDALRTHLRDNNRELYQNYDLLTEHGKPHEAELLKRFVKGSYEGKPSRPSLPPKKKSAWWLYLVWALLLPVLAGLAVMLYAKVVKEGYDWAELNQLVVHTVREWLRI